MDIKYAVYPGTVTTYSGQEITWSAADLAAAYGVQDEDYLVVLPGGAGPVASRHTDYFQYIHLKPRADNVYRNIKDTAQDDDQNITYGEDFDGSKKYTQETDPLNIDKEREFRHN